MLSRLLRFSFVLIAQNLRTRANGVNSSSMELPRTDGMTRRCNWSSVKMVSLHLYVSILLWTESPSNHYTITSIRQSVNSNLKQPGDGKPRVMPVQVLKSFSCHMIKAFEKAIYNFQQEFDQLNPKFTFASVEVSTLGVDFLRSHKCPSQSGVQLAIQLASQRFFGCNPPALETVSMAHFRKGRVEVHHIIGPAVARFLESVKEVEGFPKNVRVAFLDAAKAHAKSLSKVRKGKGFSRHLLALEWMVHEGEEKPKLFEDPVYVRLKPGKVMTSSFTTGWLEGGFFYPVPESILIYFEIRDER